MTGSRALVASNWRQRRVPSLAGLLLQDGKKASSFVMSPGSAFWGQPVPTHCQDTIPKIRICGRPPALLPTFPYSYCGEGRRQERRGAPTKQIFPGPQSQFPLSCVCERFMYSHDRSAYSAAGKYVNRSWEYSNRSQTHECGN